MRPFKFFFGFTIAVMLFFVVAKFFVAAFIIAAVMSFVFAIFRRLKDFISYDRYGEPYWKRYEHQPRYFNRWEESTEPLFYGSKRKEERYHGLDDFQFIQVK